MRWGRLKIVYYDPWKIRHILISRLLAEAAERLGSRSLPPFYVNTGDKPNRQPARSITEFGPCSVDGFADVAAPDTIFEGWPEARFEDFDAEAARIATASEDQPVHDRAFWLGRNDNAVRASLVEISTRHPDMVEAVDALPHYDMETHLYQGQFMSMADQVARYRYMIDVEGFGYSGRFKLLLHAGRVVLRHDGPYREFFFDDLEPFRHYVPVRRDFSDLLEQIEWLRSHPAREAEIIREARHFARTRLTREAAVDSWALLLEMHVNAGGNMRSGLEHLPRAPIWDR
jgi:hypothetical protein